ncbi:protein kinase domain-containing protein [Streptosporangium soli]|nr:protein kinase [Streptosporangium sp. KLBMP 9127]
MGKLGRVGPYTLLERLGRGGMGEVYLAGTRRGERVALKMLRDPLEEDSDARLRLEREVRALRRVESPYVARVIDADLAGDRPYLVMEHIEGDTLLERVRRSGPLSRADLITLAQRIATALAIVHAAGVVHRDLKPANVLLGADGPILIDFGIAQLPDATRLTLTGTFLGTPGYAAPELFAEEPVGEPADVHAWAATVAFAATGRPTFGRGTVEAQMYAILNGQADLTGVPVALLPLVRAALNRSPDKRPTAVVLADRITRLAHAMAAHPAASGPALAPDLATRPTRPTDPATSRPARPGDQAPLRPARAKAKQRTTPDSVPLSAPVSDDLAEADPAVPPATRNPAASRSRPHPAAPQSPPAPQTSQAGAPPVDGKGRASADGKSRTSASAAQEAAGRSSSGQDGKGRAPAHDAQARSTSAPDAKPRASTPDAKARASTPDPKARASAQEVKSRASASDVKSRASASDVKSRVPAPEAKGRDGKVRASRKPRAAAPARAAGGRKRTRRAEAGTSSGPLPAGTVALVVLAVLAVPCVIASVIWPLATFAITAGFVVLARALWGGHWLVKNRKSPRMRLCLRLLAFPLTFTVSALSAVVWPGVPAAAAAGAALWATAAGDLGPTWWDKPVPVTVAGVVFSVVCGGIVGREVEHVSPEIPELRKEGLRALAVLGGFVALCAAAVRAIALLL